MSTKNESKEIPFGTIMYWNNRTKKWHKLKAGLKTKHKLLGIMTPNGTVLTRGSLVVNK